MYQGNWKKVERKAGNTEGKEGKKEKKEGLGQGEGDRLEEGEGEGEGMTDALSCSLWVFCGVFGPRLVSVPHSFALIFCHTSIYHRQLEACLVQMWSTVHRARASSRSYLLASCRCFWGGVKA